MDYRSISNKLWCGTINEFTHDMAAHEVIIIVEVNDSSKLMKYKVNFTKVAEINFDCEHPDEKWEYTELTEINIKKENGQLFVECDLWSSAKMNIRCGEILINEVNCF